jgi:ribonuclease HII
MHKALDQLPFTPDCLLIDGNRFNPYRDINFECVIGGDGIYKSIAAASVLAKTHRDELMYELHLSYPEYGWDKNKGYPTAKHRNALAKVGPSPYHRKSFRLLPKQLEIHWK